MNSKQIKFGRT